LSWRNVGIKTIIPKGIAYICMIVQKIPVYVLPVALCNDHAEKKCNKTYERELVESENPLP